MNRLDDIAKLATLLEVDEDEVVERVAALVADLRATRELIAERERFEAIALHRGLRLDEHARLTEPLAFESPDPYGWNGRWLDWADPCAWLEWRS